jgi:hypothetical protein
MAAWARATAARNADELRDRVDEAASLLEGVGNAYHLATLFGMAAACALFGGRDGEATVYLQRAVPLVRRLDIPYEWMLLLGNAGVAALVGGDTEAADAAFREELTLSRELVVPPAASEALTWLAAVAAVDNELERCARLVGAAAAHPHDSVDLVSARLGATILEPARTRFGVDAWDVGLREGAALRFNEAIAFALDEPRQQAGSAASDPPARTVVRLLDDRRDSR